MENSEQNSLTSSSGEVVRKLLKTVSSPTALNTQMNRANQPHLSQIGKQTSLNVRLSQIYDSGAESGDNDDYTRLIRTPSSRSHKFIIIPSSSISNNTKPVFHQAQSTSSLGNMPFLPKTLTKTSSSSATTTATMQEQTTQPQIIPKTLGRNYVKTLASARPTSTKVSKPFSTTIPTTSIMATTSIVPITETIPTNSSSYSSPSHQANASVTFTIEDYESDNNAIDAIASTSSAAISPAIAIADQAQLQHPPQRYSHFYGLYQPTQHQPTQQTISAINSASSSTPNAICSLQSNQQNQLSDMGFNSSVTPTLEVNLRPQCARNNSMRSVVSAYYHTDSQYQQYIQPRPMAVGRQLSASSCLYRDQASNQLYSDVISVRSLTSIGIGSTDGRRLVIKKVPQTPTELFNIISPPTPPPPGIDDDDDDSFLDVSDETANLKPRQQHWGSKMQFVLACIGYSVGLGNVWRFPYMCYKSGGGVFLVPYCIILIICSIPLLFMELSVGQYTGRGPIGALGQLCPLFKGAGLASVVVSFLMSTYYSVIIGYSIYYFFTSFRTKMPWIDCENRWNTPDCWVPQRKDLNMTAPALSRTPSEEFFENKVLQISRGLEFPGQMRWELFACLICAWLMVYFATWKSIKSSAKVRYFTATFPFVLIIILMGRAVTLDGADVGLRFFFRPDWSQLKNANVWINAASQNFNSLGITFGSMISFASYNKYNNNIIRDTVAVSVVNVLTSLLVGVFAFATLGNLALEQNTNVKDVIGDGPGLIFVVYPQAMAKMPYAQLWAVMFFFMLLCLGLNSQFAIVEVVVTSIQDGFPNWIKRNLGYHEIVVLFVCVISFLFGLPNLIQGGIYYFQLMDHYAASVTIMFLAFCQMIAVAWFYGTGRLSKNVKQMTGKAPSFYFKSCWILLGPCLLFAIWVLSLVNYEEPSYHNGRYKYPSWAYGIGWMFASFSLVCIPGYAIINMLRAPGNTFWERLKMTLHPNIYECKICGEHHCEHDYPEQEQFMLAQELAGIHKPTSQGGIYYFQLMDHYAASVTIMFLAFCQMIAVAWFYGTGRLSKNVKQMTGKAPSFYFKSCWILLGPCLLFAIWVLSLVNYEEPSYHNGRYKYPSWAYGIGWMFASFSLVCIPGYAIINMLRAPGNTFWERLKMTLHPNIYECKICGEHHCEHDYPEQEQFMLAQELAGIHKPTSQVHTASHVPHSPKSGYNPMYLQNPPQQQPKQIPSQHHHGDDDVEAEPFNKTANTGPS